MSSLAFARMGQKTQHKLGQKAHGLDCYNLPVEKKYLRMIKRMKEKEAESLSEWSVYIVRCADDTLYTGIAKNVAARLSQHNSGKGAAYTRTRRPVSLLYRQDGLTRSEALVREARIKSLPRPHKERIISGSPSAL